ncbi:MAG TPA: polymer-forming cytoskeletal protein [bacterium]|nr:polymer-forming cytoskeletal protein [bacterium]
MRQDQSHSHYRVFKAASAQQSQQSQPAAAPKPAANLRKVTCPHCNYDQLVHEEALSDFCKNCKKRITLAAAPSKTPQPQKTAFTHHVRSVTCSNCGVPQHVPNNALSSFCQKCGNRINLQDYEIKGKFNGELSTKGTMTVTISGDVHADVKVGSAVIEGKMVGKITAEGVVELKSTARLYGDVIATQLIVNDGAIFVGHSLVPSNIRIEA